MKKHILFFTIPIILFSCGKQAKSEQENSFQSEDSLITYAYIDTFALTLDALRHKKLPENYLITGDLKTDVLKFLGYEFDDLAFFVFENSTGKKVSFNGNDTHFELIIPRKNAPIEKILPSETVREVKLEKNIPNPQYLNKKFWAVWRTIQLNRNPENEKEYYYQEYDEIIYLKLL